MRAIHAGSRLVASHRAPQAWADSIDQFNDWMEVTLLNVSGVKITLGSLLAALVVLTLFLLASVILRRLLRRYVQRHAQINRSSAYTVERLTHYVLLIVGVLFALNATGIPIAKFAVFAGAIGVGLGFGLQAIFSNFFSGLILLFERSLKVGDFVQLASGVRGTVRDIHIRATRICTNDNIDILVPNSEFVSGQVVNWTLFDAARRLHVPFRVAYGTDKEMVRQAALEAAAAVPFTLSQEEPRGAQVWLTGFGDSALNFELVVWLTAEATPRPGAVTAAYNWALHTALEKYGIEIPFPQRDLNIRSWPGEPTELPQAAEQRVQGRHSESNAIRDVQRDIVERPTHPSFPTPSSPTNHPDAAH